MLRCCDGLLLGTADRHMEADAVICAVTGHVDGGQERRYGLKGDGYVLGYCCEPN